jgi:hypothetical protein
VDADGAFFEKAHGVSPVLVFRSLL